nr:MAG: AAA family ATPase [Actinomycetota bacterium]
MRVRHDGASPGARPARERGSPNVSENPAENPAPAQPEAAPAQDAAPAADAAPELAEPTSAEPTSAEPTSAEPAPKEPSAELLALGRLRTEVGKAVVGQDSVVTGLVIALLCNGHVLLEGVPGVAKTLLVRTLAQSLGLDFARIQFTPDLMPGDVTGSLVYDARTAAFSFREGPVFTNLLLADEINRTPPKTQSALLEAMEERQVTVDGEPRALPQPFLVIATQNPIEYEGTYPLPEAQLDRFMLKIPVALPDRVAEAEVLRRHAEGFNPRDLAAAGVTTVASAKDLAAGREALSTVEVSDDIVRYIVDICRATREAPSVAVGVSPRGATALLATSRAWAWLRSRDFVSPDDVKALAAWTLSHRIQLRPEAQLEGVTADTVLASVLASVPVPR